MFSLIVTFIISLISIGSMQHKQTCIASVFGTVGDKHMGTQTACKPYRFNPEVRGIAHRTLPCGSRVLIILQRSGRAVEARVVDRGPYGAVMDDGLWGKKFKRTDEGKWRGCVDLTPALSNALGHDGWDQIELRY